MSRWSKYIFAGITIFAGILLLYKNVSVSSPERDCESYTQGDPTCMSIESLFNWCLNEEKGESLPQCIQLNQSIRPKILEAILNDKRIEMYLHPNQNGRLPIQVSNRLLNLDQKYMTIEKFGKPVLLVPEGEKSKEVVFRFKNLFCGRASYCDIEFSYPIEGLVGSALIRLSGDEVLIESLHAYEK